MKNDTCPQCGCQTIRKGVMFSAATKVLMYPADNLKGKGLPISARYCKDCGYILAHYVDGN